ncbi:MAG: hypothetical protein GC192_23445 [Bacteroidetes bacterium]|nr:hypothetical protein [Bacteroidota bacterium]
MAVSNKQKAEIAYDLYMNTEYTQKQICDIVGWSEKTFTKHKQEGSWDQVKGALQLTPQKIIQNLYDRMFELSLNKDKVEADKLIKLANSIEKITDRRVTVSNIINVFKEFTSFVYDRNPELAKQINGLQQEFVNHKINQGG